MTNKQEVLYTKLRRTLMRRGIKTLPTLKKIKEANLPGNKIFMLIKVMSEEVKTFDSWEYSHSFRNVLFNKFGHNFSIYQKVEEELNNVLVYTGFIEG